MTATALVLGGSGFVGKHLVGQLIERDTEVVVLNRGRTPSALPTGVARLTAERTDAQQMRTALAGRDWDAVYDVSGFVMAAGGSDIEALLGLLEGHVGHYVYVSSIMAYDQSLVGVFPWTEDLPTSQDGAASYGGFKALAETAMLGRHAENGFPGTVVRPAAIYGPDNNIFDMELPMFLRLLGRRPIIVPHGGLVVGSYGHVDDLCEAMAWWRTPKRWPNTGPGRSPSISSGRWTTFGSSPTTSPSTWMYRFTDTDSPLRLNTSPAAAGWPTIATIASQRSSTCP